MNMEKEKCPICNSSELDYCDRSTTNETVTYEVSCLYCGFEGLEWYSLTFQKYTDVKGNDLVE